MPKPEKMKKEAEIIFYTVIYRKYDSIERLHGKLYYARYDYLEDNQHGKYVVEDMSNGMPAKWVYTMSKRGLKWKKTVGGKVVQRSASEPHGRYSVVTLDDNGNTVSKCVFDRNHQWLYNEYYTANIETMPYIIIEPGNHENELHFEVYDEASERYSQQTLYACAIDPEAPEQTVIDNELGRPEIYAATNRGDFCYCTQEECRRRTELAQNLSKKEDDLTPKWDGPDMSQVTPQPPDFDLDIDLSKYQYDFTPAQMGVEPVSRHSKPQEEPPEQAEPETPPEPAPQAMPEPAPAESAQWKEEKNPGKYVDFETLLNTELPEEQVKELEKSNELALEESKKRLRTAQYETTDLKDAVPAGRPEQLDAYYANRELYRKDNRKPVADKLYQTQVQSVLEQVDAMLQQESTTASLSHVTTAKNLPERELTQPEPKAEPPHTEADSTPPPEPPKPTEPPQSAKVPQLQSVAAAKRIVVSEEESYLYFGRLINGLRQGHGRTENESGYTAYDGYYRDDKRDGFGVYYYKSGQICYVGDWKENQRHGVGVSYTPRGENLYVGSWRENQPVGNGALFDREGNLSFAGRIENGQRQGAGVSYRTEDGTVFVGQWKDNTATGKGSAFDKAGNLIYTGMWKDGKRHGFGTEYDQAGNVVYTGTWEDDRYLDGMLYQKIGRGIAQTPGVPPTPKG